MQWYFPRDIREVPDLLAMEGVHPHGGGTGILRGGMDRFRGLVDVGKLGLDYVHNQAGTVRLGAGTTYAGAIRGLTSFDTCHPLVQALGSAATTPLRNRITVGGSVASFPYWSDLMGSLLALEAEVELAGGTGGSWPVSEYAARRELRAGSLVTEIRWREGEWRAAYYRHTRTRVDHPAFSITVLARMDGERPAKFGETRVVLVGCTGRYRRLKELEERLAGGDSSSLPIEDLCAAADVSFPARMGFSPEYLSHCARVEMARALRKVAES